MTRGSPEASPISFGGPLPCGICAREVPREPVVLATCGHVYCWSCLYRSDPSPTEIASAARALAAPPAAASSRSSFGALPTRRHPPRVESSKPPPGTSSLAPAPEATNRAAARHGSVPPPPLDPSSARASPLRYIVRLDAHPCPACDVPFTRESISPIYTRGGSGEDECEEAEADARGGIPPRPTARGIVSSRRRVSPGRPDTSDAGGGRAGECAKIALGVGAMLVGIAAMVFVT